MRRHKPATKYILEGLNIQMKIKCIFSHHGEKSIKFTTKTKREILILKAIKQKVLDQA